MAADYFPPPPYPAKDDPIKAITANAISPVPTQPRAISHDLALNLPISLEFATITIIMAMIGTATMPLSTALHTQHVNGVDPGKAKSEADNASGCDDRVESDGVGRLCLECRVPSECFGYPIGGRAGQHRYCQHACADNTEGEKQKSKIPCQRPQRFGGLGR